MITIVLSTCPAKLRGYLTRWLEEIAPGVFVGRVNARLRDRIWGRILELVKDGRALMVYPSRSAEQGYEYKVHHHKWEPVDFDGLKLIRRPLPPGAVSSRRLSGRSLVKSAYDNPAAVEAEREPGGAVSSSRTSTVEGGMRHGWSNAAHRRRRRR